jgi:hypothetical protein
MYHVRMAKEKFARPELPEKDDPDYVEKLVDACIFAFVKFGDDTMALDYIGVTGKTRPIVLENERYKTETKRARAEKFLEEIDEIEEISRQLKDTAPKESQYDVRNPKDSDNYVKDVKDTLALRLKVADMRREVLSIQKSKDAEENDALNVFFIALTPAEFEAMSNVEIHEGTDAAKFEESSKKSVAPKSSGVEDDHEPDSFFVNADGSIEEIDA